MSEPPRHSPALRLLASRGRLVTGRQSIVLAATLARRRGSNRVYTLWPDASAPMISADVGYPAAAEWLRKTTVPALRRMPDAAAWMALRAGAGLVAHEPGVAERVGRRALPPEATPRVAMHSPSGHAVSKAICFLFVDGETEPRVVAKAMADPRFSSRLRGETQVLRLIRKRVSHEPLVAAALPSCPLVETELDGDFVTVEPLDRLAVATGRAARGAALAWLRSFHHASCTGVQPWDEADVNRAIATVRFAWQVAAPASAAAIVSRVAAVLQQLIGSEIPHSAVHGDFWRGNIAARDGQLRVFDWEWAKPEGTPLFDLWTYELAELRLRARSGCRDLEASLRDALTAVREELQLRGIDTSWALAMLAPVLAEFSFRVRRQLGIPSAMEVPSMTVMAAAERVLDS